MRNWRNSSEGAKGEKAAGLSTHRFSGHASNNFAFRLFKGQDNKASERHSKFTKKILQKMVDSSV